MKKFLFFLALLLLAAVSFSLEKCFAQESQESNLESIDSRHINYDKTPINKLGRGVINTLTCLVEIPGEAIKVSQEKDPLTGCTLGVVEGFCTAFLRGATGIFDVVTFVIPPYNKPLMQPEYALRSAMEKCKEIPKPLVPVVKAEDQGN